MMIMKVQIKKLKTRKWWRIKVKLFLLMGVYKQTIVARKYKKFPRSDARQIEEV